MILSIVCAVIAAASGAACQDQQQTLGPRPVLASIVVDSSLIPAADAYVKASSGANANFGSDTLLQVMAGPQRALVRFDQAQIATAIGADSLVSATLQLTIVTIANWDGSGTLSLHRMARGWTEAGATWNCSIDTNPANGSADCDEAGQWPMGNPGASDPYLSSATSSITVNNNQTGVVQFDVTADVRAFLAGTTNNGWLIKKDDGYEGFAHFRSKETASKPRLVLNLIQGDTSRPAVPTTIGTVPSDSLAVVIIPGDTTGNIYFRRILALRFDDTTSGIRVQATLATYGAQIIGGLPNTGAYVVRIPDPGPTYDNVQTVRQAIEAATGVDYVAMVEFRSSTKVDGRYPTDGPGSSRTDWFAASPSPSVWPRLAVRAPLAWGCETGEYGGSVPKIGVVDFIFDSQHPDFQRVGGGGNVAAVILAPPGMGQSAITAVDQRDHGTVVAGIIGAVGNNGTGIAGMVWRTDMYLLALSDNSVPVASVPLALADRVFPVAESLGIRVLSISLPVWSRETSQIAPLTKAVARYLRSGGIVVQSAGNENLTRSDAELRDWPTRTPAGQFQLLKVVLARIMHDSTALAGRIVFVAGVNQQGARWIDSGQGSNVWTGITKLAAPAAAVRSLANRSVSGTDTVSFGGTSVAAPFVAGAAGMLLSSYPALTADELVNYLVDGAVESRVRADSGTSYVPAEISNMSGVHLLDAYGSLEKLSKEHSVAPLCGADVHVSGANSIAAEWPGVARPFQVSLEQNESVQHVSVAQGGRRMAVHLTKGNSERSIVMDFSGSTLHIVPNARRVYLERDTADISYDSLTRYQRFSVRGPTYPTGTGTLNPVGIYVNQQNNGGFGRIDVSPSADYALIRFATQESCDSITNDVHEFAILVSVPGLTPTTVTTAQPFGCNLQFLTSIVGAGWSDAGRSVAVARVASSVSGPPAWSTGWALGIPGSSPVPPVSVSGVAGGAVAFTAADSLMVSYEFDQSSLVCHLQYRRASSPQTAVGPSVPVSENRCHEDPVVVLLRYADLEHRQSALRAIAAQPWQVLQRQRLP